MSKTLVLGCGTKTLNLDSTVVRVDSNPTVGADCVWDIDRTPWPFKDNEFDCVIAEHILEHCTDLIAVMNEIHRVCKGTVQITVPYFRSKWAYLDPTHKIFFTADTLNYFIHNHEYNLRYRYTDKCYTMKQRRFNYLIDQTAFQKLLILVAEKYTMYYENVLSPMFPLETVYFELEVVK